MPMQSVDPADVLPVLPRVTRAEFEAITCNRCGACCESLWLPSNIIDHPEVYTFPDQEKMDVWLKALLPTGKPDHDGYRELRCSLFARDADGLGVCTIYISAGRSEP